MLTSSEYKLIDTQLKNITNAYLEIQGILVENGTEEYLGGMASAITLLVNEIRYVIEDSTEISDE